VEDKSVGMLAVFGTLEQNPDSAGRLSSCLSCRRTAGVALVSGALFCRHGKQIPGLTVFWI
jgi:hypothetical protein